MQESNNKELTEFFEAAKAYLAFGHPREGSLRYHAAYERFEKAFNNLPIQDSNPSYKGNRYYSGFIYCAFEDCVEHSSLLFIDGTWYCRSHRPSPTNQNSETTPLRLSCDPNPYKIYRDNPEFRLKCQIDQCGKDAVVCNKGKWYCLKHWSIEDTSVNDLFVQSTNSIEKYPPVTVIKKCDETSENLFAMEPGSTPRVRPSDSMEHRPTEPQNSPDLVVEDEEYTYVTFQERKSLEKLGWCLVLNKNKKIIPSYYLPLSFFKFESKWYHFGWLPGKCVAMQGDETWIRNLQEIRDRKNRERI